MAFTSGIHVTCASVGARAQASLVVNPVWSELLTSAGTTTQAASGPSGVFEIAAAVAAWVAVGQPNPDPTQSFATTPLTARILVRAGETRNIFCNSGDRLAWTPA